MNIGNIFRLKRLRRGRNCFGVCTFLWSSNYFGVQVDYIEFQSFCSGSVWSGIFKTEFDFRTQTVRPAYWNV